MSIQLLGDIHQVQERTLNAHELILFEREHEFNNEYNDNYGGQIDYNEDEGDEENCDENEFIPKYLNDGRLIGIEQQIEFLKIQEDAFGAALHANNPCHNQVEQERQYESSDEEREEVQESGLEQYRSLQKIGEGTYGVVYKAYDIKNQQTVAIKKVKLDQDCNEGVPQTTLREISILKALEEHPNIVGLKDVIFKFNKNQLFLVFEFIDHDLGWYLKNTKEITPHQVKLIMYQILNGLNFCHSRRIIHRDLKPANILIDNQGNIKIADFGLSKTFSVPVKTLTYEVETLFYRAPEILLGMQKYSLGIDMWALGCIFFELLERRILFMCDSEIDAIFKIFQLHGTPSAETFHGIKEFIHFKATFPRFKAQDPTQVFQYVRGEALDLLMQMIALNPKDRITVKEALQHPYFDSLSSVEKNKYQTDNNPNELDLNYFSYC